MFDILENIAFYEAASKTKKKVKPVAVPKKRMIKETNSTFNAQKPVRMKKETNSTFQFGARSKSSHKGPDDLPFDDLMPSLNMMTNDTNQKNSEMSFGDEQEEEKDVFIDSPKGSVSSEHSSMFEVKEEEEADEFEDAEEGTLLLSDQEQMKQLKQVIITDFLEERIALPCIRDARIKGSAIWTVLKDMIGKDITKYSMPVIFNEPLSNLQKYSEILSFNYLLQTASEHEDSLMRLVYISVYSAAKFFLIHNRLQKPFNSLLGETFEVVTPDYRAISE